MLSIVADLNIPCVYEAFSSIGNVHVLDAESISAETCSGADILLVRSVTKVNKHLLEQSQVTFVGTASAGFDHVDQPYLQEREIQFAHAPGSNAVSVVEYVLTALIRFSTLSARPLDGLTMGIVGCGNIGGRLAKRAPVFGLKVLLNDPPLAKGGNPGYVDLDRILSDSDILTLHVPRAPDTYHLIGDRELQSMKSGAWLVNAARGNVVDNQALKQALITGRIGHSALDVWENEPCPDLDLLQRVTLATPHIAGHSVDGKLQGTIMLYNAVTEHYGIRPNWDYEQLLCQNLPDPIEFEPKIEPNWLDAVSRRLYDIDADDARMRDSLLSHQANTAEAFRQLRRTYPPRRTFHRHRIANTPSPYLHIVRDGLCVSDVER
ncbi:MAG: 4-phosphoerythronate dehydrogenase [Bacteroidetes bacterium]|nr:4-phosphoerythronate dehydrogenase [Bacteroidota bacterium]MCY4205227.1 4-phosphoerythronate dehydrogenase [Bacteroidota bacterium]